MDTAQHSTAAWNALDTRHHLHPSTDYKALAAEGGARIITRTDGIYLWDAESNRILDGMAGLGCVNVGYRRRELAEAAYQQLLELSYYNCFFKTATPPIALAAKLAALTPPGLDRVLYANSRSEANDTVVRLVRHYWNLRRRPRKKTFISRRYAYHGVTLAGASLSGMAAMHAQGAAAARLRPCRPALLVRFRRQPRPGGIRPARRPRGRGAHPRTRPGHRRRLHRRADPGCRRRHRPARDLLAGGAADLPRLRRAAGGRRGGLRLRPHRALVRLGPVRDRARPDDPGQGDHLGLRAALGGDGRRPGGRDADRGGRRVLPRLLLFRPPHGHRGGARQHRRAGGRGAERVRDDTDPYLQRRLAETFANHPLVGEVRGTGFIVGIELVEDKATRRRFPNYGRVGTACRDHCFRRNLIMRAVRDAMVLAPLLIATREQIDALVGLAKEAIDVTARGLGRL